MLPDLAPGRARARLAGPRAGIRCRIPGAGPRPGPLEAPRRRDAAASTRSTRPLPGVAPGVFGQPAPGCGATPSTDSTARADASPARRRRWNLCVDRAAGGPARPVAAVAWGAAQLGARGCDVAAGHAADACRYMPVQGAATASHLAHVLVRSRAGPVSGPTGGPGARRRSGLT